MLTQWGGTHFTHISEIVAITEFVIPTTGSQHMPVAVGTDPKAWQNAAKWYGWMVGNVNGISNKNIADRPHEGGRNYAFLDGHAEYRKWQDVTSANFGLLIQGKNTYEAEDVIGSNVARVGKMIYPP
jgi:prepilin-type processing-associated H-X9-DG protein